MRNLKQVVDRLYELKDEFQDLGEGYLHDDIYIQIKGILDDYDLNEEDESLLVELNQMVNELEKYAKALERFSNIKWIFG
jgi:hypothetical protein